MVQEDVQIRLDAPQVAQALNLVTECIQGLPWNMRNILSPGMQHLPAMRDMNGPMRWPGGGRHSQVRSRQCGKGWCRIGLVSSRADKGASKGSHESLLSTSGQEHGKVIMVRNLSHTKNETNSTDNLSCDLQNAAVCGRI